MDIVLAYHWLKYLGFAAASVVSGWLAGFFYWLSEPSPAAAWWESPTMIPAMIGGAAGVATVLIGKLFDYLQKSKELGADAEEREEDRHRTFSDKRDELLQRELTENLRRRDELHEREKGFLQDQILHKDVEIFSHRQRAHRYGNELTRLHGEVMKMQLHAAQQGFTLPPVDLRGGERIMDGLEETVEKYRETIREEHFERVRRAGEGKEK